MPSLSIENEERIGSGIVTVGATPSTGFEGQPPQNYLTNDQIRNVMRNGQAFHTPNKLILKLRPGSDEPDQPIFHPSMSQPDSWGFQFYFRDRRTSDTGLERDTFGAVVNGIVSNITVTGRGSNVEIEFSPMVHTEMDRIFARHEIFDRPEHGFMYFTFRAGLAREETDDAAAVSAVRTILGQPVEEEGITSVNRFHYIIKISFEPVVTAEFSARPLATAGVEFARASFTSKPLAFESLHVPSLTGNFRYNFFEVDEDSLLAARRKNYNLHALSTIPRYIELNWSPAPIVTIPILPVTGFLADPELESVIPEGGERSTIRLGESFERFREIEEARRAAQEAIRLGGRGRTPGPTPTVDDFGGGERISPERSADVGFVGRIGGFTFSIGGRFEEEAGIFGSRTSTGRMARAGLPRRFSAARRPTFVGEDSTVSLGLPEEEDLLLRELIRNVDEPDIIAGPNEFSRYIGYVLLKERFNSDLAEFEPIDMITILDRRKTRIVDTKVSYGDTYRYKVRSIFKFVNVDELPLFRDQDTVLSGTISGAIRSVFDGGIPFRNAFYFDSKFSDPVDVLTVESRRPDAPNNVKLLPNSQKHEVFITWNQKQQERDVAGFNVYRRPDLTGSVWTKLNEEPLALRHNFFVDNVLDSDRWYIYAIESLDQHDNFSKLSIQQKISLRTQDFSIGRLENPVRMHLNQETEFDEDIEPEFSEIIKFKNQMKVTINPLFGNLDRESNYLLLIKSLDTFIEKEVKLNFVTKVITHSGAVIISDDTFEERREQIEENFREAERLRFGLTSEEARRRRDRIRSGREDFEE